jgi:C_GCAxxG_C_C family probable redox protein
MSESPSEKAVAYFLRGYNCAQATAAPFAEGCGLTVDAVLRMTAGFGGGIGGLRETCGAISAMAFVAGLHIGAYAPDDMETKQRLYDQIKQMAQAFMDAHGTLCCRELLAQASCSAPPGPSVRTAEYYATRPCARLIASAADIIAGTLKLPR